MRYIIWLMANCRFHICISDLKRKSEKFCCLALSFIFFFWIISQHPAKDEILDLEAHYKNFTFEEIILAVDHYQLMQMELHGKLYSRV